MDEFGYVVLLCVGNKEEEKMASEGAWEVIVLIEIKGCIIRKNEV